MQSLRVSASTLRVASGRGVVAALLGVSTAAIPTTAVALCEGGTGGKPSIVVKDDEGNINWNKTLSRIPESAFWDDVGKVTGEGVQGAIDSGIPTQLSYGFVMGYCSGMALKRAGKIAATVLGLGFMSLQTLSYYGYVKVDHVAIKKDFENYLDFNSDGKIDKEDGKIAKNKVLEVLQYNMPAGGGFVAGFVGGLRN